MAEITYGCVDKNNILRAFFVVEETDTETFNRVKEQYGYETVYVADPKIDFFVIDQTQWNGERFIPVSPYPSWVWQDEISSWIAPVPIPRVDPKNPKYFEWNEEQVNWVEVQP